MKTPLPALAKCPLCGRKPRRYDSDGDNPAEVLRVLEGAPGAGWLSPEEADALRKRVAELEAREKSWLAYVQREQRAGGGAP